MSKLLLYHMLFGSNILGGKSIFSYLFQKLAHKKTILNKFQVESDSSDCRSPRHDGQKWYIPETCFSEDIKNTNTSEEDPDVYVNPSTSSQGNSKQITSQNECKTSSRIPIQPPKKRHINPETNSSGSWKYFNTDDSPISGLESKKTHLYPVLLFLFWAQLYTLLQLPAPHNHQKIQEVLTQETVGNQQTHFPPKKQMKNQKIQ